MKNKNVKYALLGALVLLVAGWMVLSRVDFLGDMVLGQVQSAVQGLGGVELEISPLRGNPITGFEGTGLSLKRDGEIMLDAEKVELTISLPSVLTGSPRVALLRLEGLHSDFDSLKAMLPQDTGGAPVDIPINKIALDRTMIDSPWGAFALDDSTVLLRGAQWFDLDLKGSLEEAQAAILGIVEKKDGNWSLNGLHLKVADGNVRLDGAVYPSLDLAASLTDVNLAKAAALAPQLGKVGIKGDLSGEAKVAGLGGDTTLNGSASLKNALIYGIPFPEVTADWDYKKDWLHVRLHEGRVFESQLSGDLTLDLKPENGYLELAASIRNLRFDDWKDAFTDNPHAAHFSGSITSMDANLQGPLNALVGQVSLTPSSLCYKNVAIENIKGQAVFDGKPSGSVDFSADYLGNKISLAGTLSFAEGVSSNLAFDAGALSLEPLSALFDIPEKNKPKGAVAVKASMTGLAGQWLVRGDVTSRHLLIESLGTFINVHVVPQYSFADGSLVLERAASEWNGAVVTGHGNLHMAAASNALDFSGTFQNADAERFYSLVPALEGLAVDTNASGTWHVGGTIESLSITAHIKARQATVKGVTVDHLETTLSFVPGVLTLNPARGRVGRGTVDLVCVVNIPQSTTSGAKVSWELSGRVADVNPAIVNSVLGTDEEIGGKISGTIMAGDIGDGLIWSFDAAGTDVSWQTFKADEASGIVYGDTSSIRVDEFQIGFLRSKTFVKGVIGLPAAGHPASETTLDLQIDSDNMNIYEFLRRHLPQVRGFQGLVDSEIAISGTVGDPHVEGSGRIAPFRYRSFFLPMLDVVFSGDLAGIDVDASARLAESHGSLDAKAKIAENDGEWGATLDVTGQEIDLIQIGRYLPEEFRQKLNGNVSVTMHGELKGSAFDAEGVLTSKEMKAFGVSIEEIRAPFYVMDGYAIMEDVKAKSNGGTFAGGLAFDMANSSWGGNIAIDSADIGSLMHEVAPDLKGSVTGVGGLRLRAAGDMGRTSTVRAAGMLTLTQGEVADFDAVEAAQKFTRGNPLRFDTVQVTFNYDGSYLTILPGSQAIAPANDPVYRNVMLDGMVDPKGSISLFTMGKVNIRALNALLGAIQGILNLGIDLNEPLNKDELLQGLLSGAIGGFSQNEFRFFTMNVRGTLFAPKFENIQVENTMQQQNQEVIPKVASDPKEDDDFSSGNTTFRFRFQISVGPGGRSKQRGVDDQVKGQMLQNALDSLIQGINF